MKSIKHLQYHTKQEVVIPAHSPPPLYTPAQQCSLSLSLHTHTNIKEQIIISFNFVNINPLVLIDKT